MTGVRAHANPCPNPCPRYCSLRGFGANARRAASASPAVTGPCPPPLRHPRIPNESSPRRLPARHRVRAARERQQIRAQRLRSTLASSLRSYLQPERTACQATSETASQAADRPQSAARRAGMARRSTSLRWLTGDPAGAPSPAHSDQAASATPWGFPLFVWLFLPIPPSSTSFLRTLPNHVRNACEASNDKAPKAANDIQRHPETPSFNLPEGGARGRAGNRAASERTSQSVAIKETRQVAGNGRRRHSRQSGSSHDSPIHCGYRARVCNGLFLRTGPIDVSTTNRMVPGRNPGGLGCHGRCLPSDVLRALPFGEGEELTGTGRPLRECPVAHATCWSGKDAPVPLRGIPSRDGRGVQPEYFGALQVEAESFGE